MVKVRVLQPHGERLIGDVVELPERKATQLVHTGYAEIAGAQDGLPEGAESAMQQHQPGQRGRSAGGRERR